MGLLLLLLGGARAYNRGILVSAYYYRHRHRHVFLLSGCLYEVFHIRCNGIDYFHVKIKLAVAIVHFLDQGHGTSVATTVFHAYQVLGALSYER